MDLETINNVILVVQPLLILILSFSSVLVAFFSLKNARELKIHNINMELYSLRRTIKKLNNEILSIERQHLVRLQTFALEFPKSDKLKSEIVDLEETINEQKATYQKAKAECFAKNNEVDTLKTIDELSNILAVVEVEKIQRESINLSILDAYEGIRTGYIKYYKTKDEFE